MDFRDAFLAEFDQEMAGTRKLLDAIPADQFAWRAASEIEDCR